MKAAEVKKILCVTQKTINTYIKTGKLHPIIINKTHYEYDDDEVYALVGKGKIEKKTVTYSRVSLNKQKNDLVSQKKRLYEWAVINGLTVDEELSDIKSGMNFTERKGFCKLMSMAAKRELKMVIVENRDRLSRFGFDLVEKILNELGAKVVVVSNIDNTSYEKELTDDLISIIHYYSMKSYSMRRRLHNAEKALIKDAKEAERKEINK